MHRSSAALTLAALALIAGIAVAEPQFVLRYPGGMPQVSITGEYPGATYTVWRQPAAGGDPVRITDGYVLCIGSCFATDPTAIPGQTYLYSFDLLLPDGAVAAETRFGPYLATISPALARPVGLFVYPNPSRGPTGIQLHVGGAPGDPAVQGELAIHDLAGRRVRGLRHGPIARGLTTLIWDGRDERGVELPAGVYLARFTAVGRTAVARIARR